MDRNNSIQLFEDRKIRTAWDEEQEEWYFSVQDVQFWQKVLIRNST